MNMQKDEMNEKTVNGLADHIIKSHPWVRHDLVQMVLECKNLDEVKRVKIIQMRAKGD